MIKKQYHNCHAATKHKPKHYKKNVEHVKCAGVFLSLQLNASETPNINIHCRPTCRYNEYDDDDEGRINFMFGVCLEHLHA